MNASTKSTESAPRTLAMMQPGERAVITGFGARKDTDEGTRILMSRIMEMGLTLGSEVEIAHEAPFGGTIAVRCRGSLIALRTVDAEIVEVVAS